MKKLLSLSLIALAIGLTGCGASNDTASTEGGTTLVVGATPVPHAEILAEVVDNLAEQGITLQVKEFSSYEVLNPSLVDGQLDANFFQHTSYLNNYINETGNNLVSVGAIHTEPMGLYSTNISSIDELADGAKIAIPNDVTNSARALILLEDNGLITLKEGTRETATIFDIEENEKNLSFLEIDPASLPRTLDEVDAAIINTNYALEGGLNPMEDAILIEGAESPFANILVVKEGNEDREEIQALYETLTSDEIRTFIEEKYEGSIIPAF